MAARHRPALLLLALVNTVALGVGVAILQGAIALPHPPAPLSLVAAPAPADPPAPAPPLRRAPERTVDAPAPPRAAVPRPVTISAPAPPPRRSPRPAARSRVHRQSFESRLVRQVNRIPGYRPELVRWVVIPDLAVYAVSSLRERVVYISPRVPQSKLYSVVAHEWAHILSTAAYGNDLRASQQAFLNWFGGGSMRIATERAADCMARLLGATWTHYTACKNERWRWGARYLVVGWPLPSE